jgi:hypothetical protein
LETIDFAVDEDTLDWADPAEEYASEAFGSWRAVNGTKSLDLVPARGVSSEDEEFEELARTWERETAIESFPHRKAMHPAYQQILAMGPDVVPLVLRRLERRPGHWFWALRFLTREDPAKGVDNMREARMAWIAWGRRHGYLGD